MIIVPIKEGENIERALKRFKRKFEKTGAWRLPVVDPDSKKYLGFISKSRLLMAYRAELREISLED